MKVQRDQRLIFQIYRKPTWTNNFIHFFSYHSYAIKKSILHSLFLRAFRLCDPSFIDVEIKFLTTTFLSLGYPEYFIHRVLKYTKERFYSDLHRPQNFDLSNVIILPYCHELEKFKYSLRTSFGINLVFTYDFTIMKFLVKNNDSTDSGGVYVVPCSSCNLFYVGETLKTLKVRLQQHKYLFRTASLNSSIYKHFLVSNHLVDWSRSFFIYNSNNKDLLRFIESVAIASIPNFNLSAGFCKVDPYILKLSLSSLRASDSSHFSSILRSIRI